MNRKKTWLNYLLYKARKLCTNTFCFGLALTILVSSSLFQLIKKENKNNSTNITIENNIFSKEENTFVKPTNLELEINKLEETTNCIEQAKQEPTTNLELIIEIAYLLEKHNLTYEKLINLVTNIPEYNQALQNIKMNKQNLNNKLLAILKGQEQNKTLYIGDSRTLGMLESEVINEDNSVYGVGYGYHWLIGNGNFSKSNTNALEGGIIELNKKMNEMESYNIVIWLGVNDYKYINAKTYFKKFVELTKGIWSNHTLYIVSVGPVKETSKTNVSNSGINHFNASLKAFITNANLNNLNYIDLNITENEIVNYDAVGLHYTNKDYENIFNRVTENITSLEMQRNKQVLNIFYGALKKYDETFTCIYSVDMILNKKR